ncbi:Conserved_hypothetical protein [Hexamita inflata]|uniref:Transmembrane protein n=1 Tax=Hexamita inflata TaxID=28002 RepID=A0AA86TSR8_9EUKA|nr:Conserved hypothetical protein [Hexamita inflata]
MIYILTQQLNNYECDWMTYGRIWDAKKKCIIQQSINLSATYINDVQSDVQQDFSPVNVLNLFNDSNNYYVAQLCNTSFLKNGLFIINSTIDLTNVNQQYVNISLFDQVNGSLSNISITGTIKIIGYDPSKIPNLVLSKIFGTVLVPQSKILQQFTKISSNVKFYVNGVLITQNSSEITLPNSFTPLTIAVPVQSDQLTNLIKTSISIINIYQDVTFQLEIYSSFAKTTDANAFNLMYGQSLTKYYQIVFLTNQSQKLYVYNGALVTEGTKFTQIVYSFSTKAIVLQNNSVVVCEYGNYYDAVLNQCVSACQPTSFKYQRICLSKCASNLFKYETMCYQTCPIHLGLAPDNFVHQCILCSDHGLLATEAGCLATVTNLVSFQNGYFNQCPTGLQNVSNICSIQSPCPANTFITDYSVLKDPALYSFCTDSAPDLHFDSQQSKFVVHCSSYQHLNGSCTPNIPDCRTKTGSNLIPTTSSVLQNNLCVPLCAGGTFFNQNSCQNQCNEFQYSVKEVSMCYLCAGSFDGGVNWDQLSRTCAVSCQYYETAVKGLICQENCALFYIQQSDGYECVDTCGNLFELDAECVTQCPSGSDVQDKLCIVKINPILKWALVGAGAGIAVILIICAIAYHYCRKRARSQIIFQRPVTAQSGPEIQQSIQFNQIATKKPSSVLLAPPRIESSVLNIRALEQSFMETCGADDDNLMYRSRPRIKPIIK